MNIVRIVTNETCNHRCAFCDVRRETERAAIAGARSIRRRIDAAHAAGASEVLLTGGEPTLRRDLEVIARYAANRLERVVLETNAARISPRYARALAAAGISAARVHVTAWSREADVFTGVPGAFADMRAGIAALTAAGIAIDLSIPVTRSNRDAAAKVPLLAAADGVIVGHVVIVPIIASRAEDALLPLPALAESIVHIARAARRAGMAARLSIEPFVPPCVFVTPAEAAHLYAVTPGGADRAGHARTDGCVGCAVADRCPGLSEAMRARTPSFTVRPITSDRVRRRLSIISSVPDQIERELVSREVCRRTDGSSVPAHTVRINFHCNQACGFCFVSTHLPPAPHEAIVAAIAEIGALGGVLALSGGEPTLNPRVLEYVRLGRAAGASQVELQTNATRLGGTSLAQELADAGVTHAIVSLHGATAETSDSITDSPGTFEQTVVGLDRITATTIDVRLNFVFCEANRREFPAYVDMVAARWPGVTLTISFVASSTDVVPRTRELVPRYADVMPQLAEGVRRARAKGLQVSGFESMCGLPLCLVPDDVSRYAGLADIPEGLDRGEFVKPAVCGGCDAGAQCFGVRRGYAAMHGTDELSPIRY